MSRYLNFWSCDGCEGEGRFWPAEWKVLTEYGSQSLCDRHANEVDPDHQLRIGAILEDFAKHYWRMEW